MATHAEAGGGPDRQYVIATPKHMPRTFKRDAERFLKAAKEWFRSFELDIHPDKTRLIEFGRVAKERCQERGLGRPETYDFLGFTHYCTESREGLSAKAGKIIALPQVGGLHHRYERLAA